MQTIAERTITEKVALFMSLFKGRLDAYGTYDPDTGQVRQVKEPVTKAVIEAHLMGEQPYGVYVLEKDRVEVMAADFDRNDPEPVRKFVASARHYGLPVYIERSKSKGYHAWMFFVERGVPAIKVRLVARRILENIKEPHTELFPKQDRLDEKTPYGNYINAPLFGKLVSQGRTVFVDDTNLTPFPDQWEFLENIDQVTERQLDKIIDLYDLTAPHRSRKQQTQPFSNSGSGWTSYGLPPCAQRMLREGVRLFQRIACFRLAIGLKKAGLPYDLALAALKAWAHKNKPENGKGIIAEREIVAQTAWAYDRDYKGCGCEEPGVAKFCDQDCPIYKADKTSRSTRS